MIAKVPNLRRWVVNVAIPPQLAFETLDVAVVVVLLPVLSEKYV